MATRVLKWPVRVDDQEHIIGRGQVVHVGAQRETDVVYVWTLEAELHERTRLVRVFGTGHDVPVGALHVGSAIAGPFVWHVFDVEACDG